MRSQYTHIAFLTTTLFITITSQPASGFNITPSQPGDSDRTYLYQKLYNLFHCSTLQLTYDKDH